MEGILAGAVDPLAEGDFILSGILVLGLFLVSDLSFFGSFPMESAWPGVTNGAESPTDVIEEGLA